MPHDIKPASDEVVLTYVGDGRAANGVPDRDLTHNDIARQAFLREYAETAADGKTPDPAKPKAKHVQAVIDDLVGSGLYAAAGSTRTRSARPRRAAATPAPTTSIPSEPAEPAPAEPEG